MSQEFNKENNEQPNVVFCKVNSSEDYYVLCRILSWGKWIYRGHEYSKWHLQHSLERVIEERSAYIKQLESKIDNVEYSSDQDFNNFQEMDKNDSYLFASLERSMEEYDDMHIKEYNAIRSYMSKTHQMDLSNIEALCNLQHYGGKTRLLDFTFSINIALFMALENKNKFQERCIWAINYNILNDKLEKIIIKYINNIEDFKTRFHMEGYFKNNIYNEFVKQCFYSEDPKKTPFDENLVIPIVIPDQNPRITAQNGLFLFPTTFEPFLECLCQTLDLTIKDSFSENVKYKRYRYPELYVNKKKNNVLDRYEAFNQQIDVITGAKIVKIIFSPAFEVEGEKILKASNINAYDIYPDFVGIAKSIVYW